MNYIVTTTIHVPKVLSQYVKDFQRHGHEYLVVVAGDQKSPPETAAFCRSLPHVVYLDVAAQYALFKNLKLYHYIPFNSIARRNFAYLYCIKQGITAHDTLITIDDDNFLEEPDFLTKHSLRQHTAPLIETDRPTWFNPLPHAYHTPVYPRGFSMYERTQQTTHYRLNATVQSISIAVNQGLWNQSPDLDAVSRFIEGDGVEHWVRNNASIVLGRNVLCPFNTQNTAYLNGFWATAFLCPYIGRFDDILSSFITKRIADHFGYGVSYGAPIVTQHRNMHRTYHDFLLELHGMSLTDAFVSLLYTIDLDATTITDALAQIADQLTEHLAAFAPLHTSPQPNRTALWSISQIPEGLKLWLASLDQLNATSLPPATVSLSHSAGARQ